MKYLVSWTMEPGAFNGTVARFLETGSATPAAVKLLGRWHGMSGRGFAIVETADHAALYTLLAQWGDLLKFETTPCLEDAEAGAVFQAFKK